MFRALFWKEWRQLALVRWGGIVLGALLPLAFLAGAEFAERGWLPTGSVERYSLGDLMGELFPTVLTFGLWPLIALMCAAQAFGGDRSAGTESFLLERPIPRGAVWRARGAAASGSLLAAVLATATFAVAAGAATGAGPQEGWARWFAVGLILAALALFGGTAAAAVLPPMAALLAGAVLAALPVLFGAELGSLFPHARLGGMPVGLVLPALMIPAYVAASWAAFSRGEPAGRGRTARGLSIAASSIPAVIILFVMIAPLAVRADARGGMHQVVASPSGAEALVLASGDRWGGGGWLVDVPTGRRRAFLPPPFQSVIWSPDGARFAIGTWAGSLGAESKAMHLEIRDGHDGRLLRAIEVPEHEPLSWGLAWTRDGIIAAKPRGRNATVAVIDPERGTFRDTGFVNPGWATLTAPRPDGRVFLRTPVYDPTSQPNRTRGYRLLPVDAAAGRVGPPLADAAGEPLCFAGWLAGLSPDGRHAMLVSVEPGGPARVVTLPATSEVMPVPNAAWARWLDGDRLAWVASLDGRMRLFVDPPGPTPRAIREWTGAHLQIDPNPDGKALLVRIWAGADPGERPADRALFEGEVPHGDAPEIGIFTLGDRRWRTLATGLGDRHEVRWVGPNTIAWTAPGAVAFEDLDHPGTKRFVLGSEEDLR